MRRRGSARAHGHEAVDVAIACAETPKSGRVPNDARGAANTGIQNAERNMIGTRDEEQRAPDRMYGHGAGEETTRGTSTRRTGTRTTGTNQRSAEKRQQQISVMLKL